MLYYDRHCSKKLTETERRQIFINIKINIRLNSKTRYKLTKLFIASLFLVFSVSQASLATIYLRPSSCESTINLIGESKSEKAKSKPYFAQCDDFTSTKLICRFYEFEKSNNLLGTIEFESDDTTSSNRIFVSKKNDIGYANLSLLKNDSKFELNTSNIALNGLQIISTTCSGKYQEKTANPKK